MNIFDRIKQKAQQVFQGVGQQVNNSLDRRAQRDASRIQNIQQRRQDTVNNIKDWFTPVPDKVRPRDVIREMPRTALSIPRGFIGEYMGGNPEIGSFGVGKPIDPTQPKTLWNPAPTYVPQTPGEKIGSFAEKTLEGLITGQNTGTLDATRQGLQTLSQIPIVNVQLEAAKDWIGNNLQKLQKLEIDAEKLRKAYDTLGIKPGTDPKESYRQIAMTQHPDKGGSEEAFKIINAAYKKINDAGGVEKFLSRLGVSPKVGVDTSLSSVLNTPPTVSGVPVNTTTTAIAPYSKQGVLDQMLASVPQNVAPPSIDKVIQTKAPEPNIPKTDIKSDELAIAKDANKILNEISSPKNGLPGKVLNDAEKAILADYARQNGNDPLVGSLVKDSLAQKHPDLIFGVFKDRKYPGSTEYLVMETGGDTKGRFRLHQTPIHTSGLFKNYFVGKVDLSNSNSVIQPQTPVQQTTQPKPLIDLTKEAQKYKSAEEFIKAQGESLYHGGEIDDLNKYVVGFEDRRTTNPLGIYFSDNKKVASEFGSKEIEAVLPKDSRVLDLTDAKTVGDVWEKIGHKPEWISPYDMQPDESLKDMSGGYQMIEDVLSKNPQLLKNIKNNYSGIKFKEMKGDNWFNTTVVFDPKKLQTKSQLTDIWNKANQPKPLDEVLASKEITTPIEPSVDTQSINTQIKKLGTELGKVRAEIANPKPTSNLDALRTKEAQLRSEYSNLMRIKNNETPLEKILQTPPSFKSGLQKVYEDTLPIEFKGSFGVLEKSGDAGKKIVDTIKQTQKEIDLTVGDQIADLKKDVDWGLSEQEKLTLADAVEGKIEPISENQQKAIETWNAISKDIHDRAKEAGLDIGFRENYWPHFPITKSTGKAGKMGRYGERSFGNLEKSRISNVPFDKDPSVLYDYIKFANERIIKAKNFGKADENLYNLAKETKDAGQTNKYLDQILRKNQEPSDITKFATTYNTVTKLKHTTALLNLTQNLSTAIGTDTGSTTKAVAKTITNPKLAIENAIRAGELDASTKRVFEDYAGSSDLTGFWIRFIGMKGTENFNRIVAVNAGMEYYAKLNTKALNGSKSALREIERLGMKVNGNPIEAGRKVSEQTQFDTSPGNLPYNWKTNVGKIATQFKSFAYKQTGFAADQVKRSFGEATKGNFKPLINALLIVGIAAPIVGEIISGAKSIIHNRKRTSKGLQRYLENITSATSLGLIDDFDALFGKYGGQGVVSTLLGPTAGEIYNAGQNVEDLKSDNIYDNRKAYRRLLRTIPIAGPTLANTLVPNSYVDNVWGGVNEGLSESDKEAYNEIKAVDPQKAEEFKASKQAQRDERNKEDNWLNKLFSGKSGKDIEAPSPGASKKEIDDFNDKMRTILDEGHIPSQEALKDFATKGKDPYSESIEEKQDAFSYLEKEMTNEFYTDEQKEALLKASEVDPDDYYYYERASKTNLVKLQEILPEIEQMDEKEMMIYLMQGRKTIAGKLVIADGVVNELYEMGYLTKDQKNAIKALKYNEITGEFNYKRDYSGKSSSNLTYKQAMALFKIDLPKFSEIKSPSPFSKPSAKGSATAEKTLDEILNFNPKKQTSIQDQWFKT